MEKFLTVLAWIFGIASFISSIFTIYLAITYEDSISQLKDSMKGIRRTFPVTLKLVIFIICLAWILTR